MINQNGAAPRFFYYFFLYATADTVTSLSYIVGVNSWDLYYFLSKFDCYRDRFNLLSARDLSTCCA